MIKKVFSNRTRVGWKYDPVRKQFFSWHFDIWLDDGRAENVSQDSEARQMRSRP